MSGSLPPSPPPATGRDSGLFLLSGLLLTLALLIGMAREQSWGQRLFGLRIRTTAADGLQAGMDVRIAGLPVGKVTGLELTPDAAVAIELQVQERYRHLVGPRSRAYQGQDGVLGDHYIAITPDTARDLPRRSTPQDLPYEPSVTLRDLIRGWQQTRASLQRTLDNTAVLTGRDMPQSLVAMRRTLADASRLSQQLQRQTEVTGPAVRRTLSQVDQTAAAARGAAATARETAGSARRAADEASLVLGSSRPLLLRILHDLQSLTGSSERLLRSLLGSEALAPANGSGTAADPVAPPLSGERR